MSRTDAAQVESDSTPPHEQRLAVELEETSGRLQRLKAFLADGARQAALDPTDRLLLREQSTIMSRLVSILSERLQRMRASREAGKA